MRASFWHSDYGYGLLHSATDTSSAGYFGRRPKNDRTILPTKSNSSRSDDSQFLQSKLVSTSKSNRRHDGLIGSTTLVAALKQLANPCVRHTDPFSSILIPPCLDLLPLHMPTHSHNLVLGDPWPASLLPC
ncbi:hypothetical protein LZ31DRAFT_557380 [Colletotrichum somersetense]|nr:hypothetical protein LZ31DRAFT_557380 [Colletotrichum somersetense]